MPRDPARIKRMIKKLEAAWLKRPDQRLGQLVSNLAISVNWGGDDTFYVEDDLMETALDRDVAKP